MDQILFMFLFVGLFAGALVFISEKFDKQSSTKKQ
jgi:hypothetical protein